MFLVRHSPSGHHPPIKEPRRAIALLERAVTLGSVRAINSLSGADEASTG
jgi:hypothetical protein